MINKVPESLRDKIKGKEKELEKAVLALKEYAKKDLGEQEVMTDKVQKIREEVEKLHGNPYYMMAVKDVLEILDMQEEPVSEDFEDALAREWQGYNDRGAATVDALEDNSQELAFAKGFYRGAKWGKNQAKVEIQSQSMALAHGCPKEFINTSCNQNKTNNMKLK